MFNKYEHIAILPNIFMCFHCFGHCFGSKKAPPGQLMQIHMHVKLLHSCEYNSVTNVCANFCRIYIGSYRYLVIFPQCIAINCTKKMNVVLMLN